MQRCQTEYKGYVVRTVTVYQGYMVTRPYERGKNTKEKEGKKQTHFVIFKDGKRVNSFLTRRALFKWIDRQLLMQQLASMEATQDADGTERTDGNTARVVQDNDSRDTEEKPSHALVGDCRLWKDDISSHGAG